MIRIDYIDRASHKRHTEGDIEYDTPSVLVIRPIGSKFTVTVAKARILHIEP